MRRLSELVGRLDGGGAEEQEVTEVVGLCPSLNVTNEAENRSNLSGSVEGSASNMEELLSRIALHDC